MKKYILHTKVWKTLGSVSKGVGVFLVGLSVVYSFLYLPFISQQQRIACHNDVAAEAQASGQEALEAYQDSEEFSPEELAAQVTLLVEQRYSFNYVVCLHAYGL